MSTTSAALRRAQRPVVFALLLASLVGAVAPVAAPTGRAAAAGLPPAFPSYCHTWPDPIKRADLLLSNRYQLGTHPVVTLGSDPTWTENPLGDRNWQFLHHSLGAVNSLLKAWTLTGDVRYRDRAAYLLEDWIGDNPRWSSPSSWAWNDHSTALRAIVLACAEPYLGYKSWLHPALSLHGSTLADPGFYVWHGNHALNQSIGLLEVARVLARSDWRSLAIKRIEVLLTESVDSQGVTNEQSIKYQNYNLQRYRVAESRIRAAGGSVPTVFARLDRMPRLLAYGTLPNGEYEMLGDTDRQQASIHRGTWAEFAATRGASGPKPPDTAAIFGAGYLFARTGWGTSRPYTDEVAMSLRWGAAPAWHGHADGGSITLYGYGSRLLLDPGKYTYNFNPYRTFFTGRTAHNVVTVDGAAWSNSARTSLLSHARSSTMVHTRVQPLGNPGVKHVRSVTSSRTMDYLLVEDRMSSSTTRTYRQLWHLSEDARPYVTSGWFRTQRERGNVYVRQLVAGSTSRVVTGRTAPVQGWLAYRHGERLPAPVVEVARSGSSVRYLTLIVAAAGSPTAKVSELKLTSTGYRAVITIGGRAERVVVDGSTASITPLG